MLALVIAEAVAVALLGVLVAGLLRSHADILKKLHDMGSSLDPVLDRSPGTLSSSISGNDPIGNLSAPNRSLGVAMDISGSTPTGESVVVGIAGSRSDTLLAFLSSGCSTCVELWRQFREGKVEELPGNPRIVVVARDSTEESPNALANLAPNNLKVVMSSRAWTDYGVPGAPYFIMIDGMNSSIVGEGSARSWGQIGDLVRQALIDKEPQSISPTLSSSANVHPSPTMERDAISRLKQGRLNGPQREARADAQLAAAGIGPGDASLFNRNIGEFPAADQPTPSNLHGLDISATTASTEDVRE